MDFGLNLANQHIPFVHHLLQLLIFGPLRLPVFLESDNYFVEFSFQASEKIFLLDCCHLLLREIVLLCGDSGLVSFQELGDHLRMVACLTLF